MKNVVVLDHEGEFTGVPGTVLETYELLSLAKGATKSDGSNAYIVDVLNQSSRYIGIGSTFKWEGTEINNSAASQVWGKSYYAVQLTGGSDGSAPTAGNMYTKGTNTGYALLEDSEQVDISRSQSIERPIDCS